MHLNQALNDNPKLKLDLDNYTIPTITSIYNQDLQIDNLDDLQKVQDLIGFIKIGKTFLEIENEMQRLDILKLRPKFFGNYGFQLFNYDIEYKEKRQVWRDAKLLNK